MEFIEATAFTKHISSIYPRYSKSEIENIPAHILHQIAKEIENV